MNINPADDTKNVRGVQRPGSVPPATPLTHLTAWLLAGRYDRLLAVGVTGDSGSALDVHARRLLSVAERHSIARSFSRTLRDARTPLSPWAARSYTHRPNVSAAADLIDRVTLWLHSPRPVDARGMARLRVLLSDGTGPLYVAGRGDLAERLRAALAAL